MILTLKSIGLAEYIMLLLIKCKWVLNNTNKMKLLEIVDHSSIANIIQELHILCIDLCILWGHWSLFTAAADANPSRFLCIWQLKWAPWKPRFLRIDHLIISVITNTKTNHAHIINVAKNNEFFLNGGLLAIYSWFSICS